MPTWRRAAAVATLSAQLEAAEVVQEKARSYTLSNLYFSRAVEQMGKILLVSDIYIQASVVKTSPCAPGRLTAGAHYTPLLPRQPSTSSQSVFPRTLGLDGR